MVERERCRRCGWYADVGMDCICETEYTDEEVAGMKKYADKCEEVARLSKENAELRDSAAGSGVKRAS